VEAVKVLHMQRNKCHDILETPVSHTNLSHHIQQYVKILFTKSRYKAFVCMRSERLID